MSVQIIGMQRCLQSLWLNTFRSSAYLCDRYSEIYSPTAQKQLPTFRRISIHCTIKCSIMNLTMQADDSLHWEKFMHFRYFEVYCSLNVSRWINKTFDSFDLFWKILTWPVVSVADQYYRAGLHWTCQSMSLLTSLLKTFSKTLWRLMTKWGPRATK